MSDAKVLNETAISMAELSEEMGNIAKRDKELNFRANKTKEYLNQSAIFKKSKEMEQEIVKLDIPRLKDVHIKKVLDLMPTTVDELKIIIQGYPISVSNENLKKITDVVSKFTAK